MLLEVQGFILASEWALEHRTRGIIEQAGSQTYPEILSCSERGTVSPSLPQASKASVLIRAVLIHSSCGSLTPRHDLGRQQSHQWGKRDAEKRTDVPRPSLLQRQSWGLSYDGCRGTTGCGLNGGCLLAVRWEMPVPAKEASFQKPRWQHVPWGPRALRADPPRLPALQACTASLPSRQQAWSQPGSVLLMLSNTVF